MEELAKLLGTTKERLENLAEEMGEFTGKKDVFENLSDELAKERSEALGQLGLSEASGREEILSALTGKAKKTEEELLELLKHPDCSTHEGCRIPIKTAFDLAKPPKGFFLKEEKAKELFLAHPPKGVMSEFNYNSVEEMLAKEDIYHLFSSLRFLEERSWLNEEFFASYTSLTPNDFEKREIKIEVLPKKRFGAVGAEFMRKKFHNVSHLKEMGLIFILPVVQAEGVFVRMFSLLLHYLHEVSFYAKYLEQCANPSTGSGQDFTKNLTAALRGDVRETVPPVENLFVWLIIQRYLAKEDPNDPRLAMPHISPEAMVWRKATGDLGKLGKKDPELGLSFWAGKAHVAGIFNDKVTSFNFEDNVFSAARGWEVEPASTSASLGGQYTYHMREALWNRLFTSYLDEKTLETLMLEDFTQGFVGFRIRSSGSE